MVIMLKYLVLKVAIHKDVKVSDSLRFIKDIDVVIALPASIDNDTINASFIKGYFL